MRGRYFPGLLGILDASPPAPPATDELRVTQLGIEVAIANASTIVVPPPTGGGTVETGTNPADGISLCNGQTIYVWLELQTDSGVKVYAKENIPLDAQFKEGRVSSFGTIKRGFSRDRGGYETATASIELIDTDRVLRGLANTGVLMNKRCDIYANTKAGILAGSTPRRLMQGLVRRYKPLSEFKFRIDLEDFFGSRFSEFSGDRMIPGRTITVADFPNILNATDAASPGNPTIVNTAVPIGYGLLSDEALGADAVGVVPCRFVGQRIVSGYPWDEYLVFGHAVSLIQSWFAEDAVGVRSKMPETTEGVDFLIPGRAGYIAHVGTTNTYRDWNNRRTTVIYARGPRSDAARLGKVPITLNVAGIEDVGDGTGDLIDSLPRQIQHLITNWILQSYTFGAWPAIPTIGSPAYARFRGTSTEIVRLSSIARLGGSPLSDGYVGAFMLGWNGQFHSVRDLIAEACRSCDIDIGVNRHGQIFMSMVDDALATVKDWGDVVDVLQRSFDVDRDFDRLSNRIEYRYRYRYTQPVTQPTPPEAERLPETLEEPETEWIVDQQELEDGTSITAHGETRIYDLDLPFVRDTDTADNVVANLLDRLKNGPVHATFDVDMCGTDVENGDTETLDHYGGLTATGWTDRLLRNEEHTVDLDNLKVTLVARDLD